MEAIARRTIKQLNIGLSQQAATKVWYQLCDLISMPPDCSRQDAQKKVAALFDQAFAKKEVGK